MKPTREQQAIIDRRRGKTLVSAAAGSGKTTVLVERIIQMLLEGSVELETLLISTFTDAAAAEMARRIKDALEDALQKEQDGDKLSRLQRQLDALPTAHIQTLHSFCSDIVRQYFEQAGVQSGLGVIDTTYKKILEQTAINDVFEEFYDANDATFASYVDAFSQKYYDQNAKDWVLKIYDKLRSYADYSDLLGDAVHEYQNACNDFDQSAFAAVLLDDLLAEMQSIQSEYRRCQSQHKLFDDELSGIDDIIHSFQNGYAAFIDECKKMEDLLKLRVSKYDCVIWKDAREKWKTLIKNTLKMRVDNLKTMEMPLLGLCKTLLAFDQKFTHQKRRLGMMDFADMEHLALKALRDDAVRQECSQRFSACIVDEYQDITPLQEELITAITGGQNLFLVGDIKQSIYGFRNAAPKYMQQKTAEYQNGGNLFYMSQNFRSRSAILFAVNDLFDHILDGNGLEIPYPKQVWLDPGIAYSDEDPVVSLIMATSDQIADDPDEMEVSNDEEDDISSQTDDNPNGGETPSQKKIQAAAAVQICQGWLKQEFIESMRDGQEVRRKIQPKDICILLRVVSDGSAIAIRDALMQAGIDAFVDVDEGLLNAPENAPLLAMLRIIDNPRQDYPLICVLTSAMAGFKPHELLHIRRQVPKESSFYEALLAWLELQKPSDLAVRMAAFLQKVEGYRALSCAVSPHELIWKILEDTGYFIFCGAQNEGKRRQANLLALADLAISYASRYTPSLANFLEYLDRAQSQGKSDLTEAKLLGEQDNVVRIMTVHKSKGLEFPCVLVSGMARNMAKRGADAILIRSDLGERHRPGMGCKLIDTQNGRKGNTLAHHAISQLQKKAEIAEEARLLYVAMTRAKHHLTLLSALPPVNKSKSKDAPDTDKDRLTKSLEDSLKFAMMPFSPRLMGKAKCWLDWALHTFLRHPDGVAFCQQMGLNAPEDVLQTRQSQKINISLMQVAVGSQSLGLQHSPAKVLDNWYKNPPKVPGNIREILTFEPDLRGGQTPSKTSVSALLQAQPHDIPSRPLPKWDDEDAVDDALVKGTHYHTLMEKLDFSCLLDVQDIHLKIKELKDQGCLPQDANFEVNGIWVFLQSLLGHQMKNASLLKEMRFTLCLPTSQLPRGVDSPHEVLVQGAIDACFLQKDGWVIVDYKTNKIGPDGANQLAKTYELQLQMYAKALQNLTKRPVANAYIVALQTGEVVPVPLQ